MDEILHLARISLTILVIVVAIMLQALQGRKVSV